MRCLAFAALMIGALTASAEAGFSERTREMCYGNEITYDQVMAMVARGDPDAIFCRALWDAVVYDDESKEQAERDKLRARAFALRARAEQLGYDFSNTYLHNGTFDQHIEAGDYLTRNGRRSPRAGGGIQPGPVLPAPR